MKLIFLRHGETNYNLKNWCNSRPTSKVRLTERGKKQAQRVARILRKEKFDIIFVSQLYRTQQTAKIVNQFHHVKLISDKRLNDRATGFDNKEVNLFYTWRDQQKNPWTCERRGGESFEDMKKRFLSFLKSLEKTNYKKVLIVAHLPILKIARGYFKQLTNEQMDRWTEKQVPNCKIMKFEMPNKQSKKLKFV